MIKAGWEGTVRYEDLTLGPTVFYQVISDVFASNRYFINNVM